MITDLIFHFFGTLVNYEPDLGSKSYATSHNYLNAQGFSIDYQPFVDGWSEAFAALEEQAQVDYQEYHMRDAAHHFVSQAFQTDLSPQVCDTLVDLFISDWNAGVSYHPDIKPFLTELAATFRLSIITNTHYPPMIDHHLAQMDITHLFQVVTKSVTHGLRKPHPKIFEDTLAALNIAPKQAVYIGDNFDSDYQGARQVQLQGILIDAKRQYLHLDADRVDHLYDVRAVVRG